MLPTMFTTCRVAFMLSRPVDRTLGAATASGNAGASRAITARMRLPGSAAIRRNCFLIVIFMRLGSGHPSE